jgi:hypothetical protein
MDLKEFTSPGPKPWLAINGAYDLAQASNGVSATIQPAFTATSATNVMPGDMPFAAISIPAGLCVAGMSFRVTTTMQVQTGSSGGHFRLYLAQDNGSVILSDNTDNALTGAQNIPAQIVINLSFSAVGAAGVASSFAVSNYSIGAPNYLTLANTTTVNTNDGLVLELFAIWTAGTAPQFTIKNVIVERIF